MNTYSADIGIWYNAQEYLPSYRWVTEFIDKHDMKPEFVVHIKGYPLPTILRYNGDQWIDEDGVSHEIDCWQLLPTELPKYVTIYSKYLSDIKSTKDKTYNSYSKCKIILIKDDI